MTASSRSASERAKTALRKRFGRRTDPHGYVDWPQDNLIQGVQLDQCEADLRRGDGNELYQVMRAAGQIETLLGLTAHTKYDKPKSSQLKPSLKNSLA